MPWKTLRFFSFLDAYESVSKPTSLGWQLHCNVPWLSQGAEVQRKLAIREHLEVKIKQLPDLRAVHGPWPPQAVLGPAFTPGLDMDTGCDPLDFVDARLRAFSMWAGFSREESEQPSPNGGLLKTPWA
jgi:hypothetical protein